MANHQYKPLARALAGSQSGDVFPVDWSSSTTKSGVRAIALRAARRCGLEVGLDYLADGLRLTVIGAAARCVKTPGF